MGELVASGLVPCGPVTLVDVFDLQRVKEVPIGTLMLLTHF